MKTSFKGKKIDDWKTGDENGKKMYHPEYGQLDMWTNSAIRTLDKEDVMEIDMTKYARKPHTSKPTQQVHKQKSINVVGKIDLDSIPKK